MVTRILRSDAPPVAQVTRLSEPAGIGEIQLTILGSGKVLTFPEWNATTIADAWNASTWPEFAEVTASASGDDVLLTAELAGRPFYVAATVGGNAFSNEVQTIIPINVTGGPDGASATWLGQTTDPFDPTAVDGEDLKALFEALPGGIVDADELSWSGPVGGPWQVTFGGRYAEQNVPLIAINNLALTGGTDAQNEKQRLSGAAGIFKIRRSDNLDTSSELSAPITAEDVEAALAEIGYEAECTGGPLGLGESNERAYADQAGAYDASTVADSSLSGVGIAGRFEGNDWKGLIKLPLATPQGETINLAKLHLTFATSGFGHSLPAINFTVKAVDTDSATWPASAAAAAANALTDAFAAFTSPAIAIGSPAQSVEVDVTSVVQEIVDRAGSAPGREILFYLIPEPTADYTIFKAYAADHSNGPWLDVTTESADIIIEWVGDDAETDIPLLIIVPAGGYTEAPDITPIQDGHPATNAEIIVQTTVEGGESLPIRDVQRSRGPNHYDDPLNWDCDEDDSFRVPEDRDKIVCESGRIDLLYGLRQRSAFVAFPATNRIRLTDYHHFWEGQAIRLQTSDALPAGLATGTTYYCRNVDGPYMQLAATRTGDPIDITTAGTGTHTIGVSLVSLETQSRWSGKLGLPRQNGTAASMYFEYRERYLMLLGVDAFKIGTGDGGGSSRTQIDTGKIVTIGQAINSAGPVETGVPPVLIRCDNVNNEIEALGADIGIAVFPEETSSLKILRQRGGAVTLGYGVTIANDLDKTAGTFRSLGAIIGGRQYNN